MEFTGERYIPKLTDAQISYEHWHRYLFAASFVKNKTVLDIASGEGYGSSYLANTAQQVIGIDISREAVNWANKTYPLKNLKFLEGTCAMIPIEENHIFDVIVSFETIEHIDSEEQILFLKEIKRLLKPDGILIISTPNKLFYSDRDNYKNEFHIKEFYRHEFEEFLSNYFKYVENSGQKIYTSSLIWPLKKSNLPFIDNNIKFIDNQFIPVNEDKEDLYNIAICSDIKSVEIPYSGLTDLSQQIQKEYCAEPGKRILTEEVEIQEKDNIIEKKDSHIKSLLKSVEEKDLETDNLLKSISKEEDSSKKKEKHIDTLIVSIVEKNLKIQNLLNTISDNENLITEKTQEIHQIKDEINKTGRVIQKKDSKINELEQIIHSVKISYSWKITEPLRWLSTKLKLGLHSLLSIWLIKKIIWYIGKTIFVIAPLSISTKEKLKQKLYNKHGRILNDIKKPDSLSNSNDDQIINDAATTKIKKQIIKYVPWQQNNAIQNPLIKVIAFYLPQFHAIPENDSWWGKGFTEWTNVKPAQPQFKGHYQPHIPEGLGYYNLLDEDTFEKQIKLAKNYGIGGFCFHFYWFGGKLLLEKPIEKYLSNPNLDLPFCLSWANENWTRRWDGRSKEILIAQQHSPKDDLAFIEHVSKYMLDKRYIRIDKKPLLLVYRSEELPSAKETAKIWRDWCRTNGVGEIYLVYVQSFEKPSPEKYGYDAAVEFPPNYSGAKMITHEVKPINKDFKCNVFDWSSMVELSENYNNPGYKLFRGVCPGWDNTARMGNKSHILINSHPDDFKRWMQNASIDTIKRFDSQDERLVFVNAWNEWAEGAHLEPDKKHGYAYLQSIYDASKNLKKELLQGKNENKPKILVVSYNIPKPDKSSGELRFVGILELMLEHWAVDFCIAEDKYSVDWNMTKEMIPYFENLSNKGINILPFKQDSFRNAITNNTYAGGYFNLYWMAKNLMPLFKQAQPSAYAIVDSVDVHFAREITQANLGKIEMSQALQTKEEEMGVYHAADVVIAVSKDDYNLLKIKEQVKDVFVVPNIIPVAKRKSGKRKPIVIFIGSYTWPPNIDSVKWFTSEVWPFIIKVKPDAQFLIIGSDPTRDVLELAKIDGVEVVGYVPETKTYLDNAAVSVAPLRYGGGMKGKVNEAMAHGVPVVSTVIGAQGFNAVNGKEMMITDDAKEFAECVIKLLSDDILQQEIGLAGLNLNSAISSPESVKIKIDKLFKFCDTFKQQQSNLKYPLPAKPEGNLIFPELAKSPIVSIIIPIYNQWEYTFACLKSILRNSGNIQYEIILADDNSTDDTKNAKDFVKNIHVLRNKKNLGFLYNCNNAAKNAKGKYIVFLNNDTLVQTEWLEWFVKTMEERPNVGLVGAKVVFATGKLQEAGSIVFKDGSAMNYGREDDPDLPQYNYFKDVDYGSGCSICIRKDLWVETGGFDTRYAPAYYEDTDMAIQIRQLGYRTVYQPKTVIIHFEGVSHGTDLSEGIKQNQARNQKIFFKKWKGEFEKNNYSRDENLFRSRDRSMHKHMVLLIDYHTPTSFLDEKVKSVQLINHFIGLDYIIKFLPNDFCRSSDYVTDFEQQGIEFLYGERCKNNWQNWLQENTKNFDLVCFADEKLKEKYLPVLSKLLNGKANFKIYNQIT